MENRHSDFRLLPSLKNFGIVLVCTLLASAAGAQPYQKIHGPSGFDYSVKAEIELEYASEIVFSTFSQTFKREYQLKAPFFLAFNLNDLKFFKAEPSEFIGYEDNFMNSSYVFSDSENQHEITAGMMLVSGMYMKSESPAEIQEQKLAGAIGTSPEINFSLLGLSRQLRTGKKPMFTLFISASPCPNCEQEVKGYGKFTSQEGNTFTVTEGLTLDVTMNSKGESYETDLVNALMANNLLEADKKVKNTFEEGFMIEYYKDLMKIEALPLIDYLMNPKGVYEIPFAGFIKTTTAIPETTTFKGKLIVYGEKRYQFWVAQ
jgi:hypothetical protein